MRNEMSTKASPPTSAVKIKKEVATDEIKDFAETAMNELLGWYGYDNVDRVEFQQKSTRLAISGMSLSDNSFRNDSNHDTSGAPSHDSSREDSRSPSSVKNCDKTETHCGWCKRAVSQNSPEFLTTPEGPRYCSESCFAQSRRASFKRAKTCDWCRHVRHAVSYVDFQDGASQLQFCSDKCLNQYKMQIFCKETQAHLDMNPHLKDKNHDPNAGSLITPELWLKNCRSRSATPEPSDVSRSPTPTQKNSVSQPLMHKPVISVAPPSKLLTRSQLIENIRHAPKHSRKRRFTRMNISDSANQNGNSNPKTTISTVSNTPKMGLDNVANPGLAPKSCTFTNVQDLRMNMPALSPVDEGNTPGPTINPPYFSAPPPNAFNIPSSLFNNHPHPRLLGLGSQHPMLPMPGNDFTGLFQTLGAAPPPVTVMVPYPIIVPLPIPIPIPLPITEFIKAAESKKNGAMSTQNAETSTKPSSQEENVEPLDCSKSKSQLSESTEVEDLHEPDTAQVEILNNHDADDSTDRETLPRLKITRLNSRRAVVNTPRESESSRPLRKRKRVIDCDYVKPSKEFEEKNIIKK